MSNSTKLMRMLYILQKSGIGNLNRALTLLCVSENEGINTSQLGKVLGLDSSSTRALCSGLAKKGYLGREITDGVKGVRIKWHSTDKARKLINRVLVELEETRKPEELSA